MRKNKKRAWLPSIFLTMFLCCHAVLFAQNRTVTGTVKESDGEPIIGASVVLKGTNIGTVTDIDGNFKLSVPANGKTLLISYLGMKSLEAAITGAVINVTLEDNTTDLEEVVVIGYGTVKKKDLTGAVSSMGDKTLKDIPVTSVSQAMAGRLTGVNVTVTEGSPDADIKIRVRGGGSITQDNSPLYVVDGFIVNNINDIPPTDIESVDVLKDAASTAIYGASGANGVITITTKSGKEGKTSLKFNSYWGVKKATKQIEVLNPYEYVYWQYEIDQSETFQNYYGRYQDLDIYKSDKGTNWQDEIFGRTAFQQNYNLSIMGGNETTKYNVSLNHIDEDFIMINSGYKRSNANIKINTKLNNNIDFVFNTRLSYTDITGPNVSEGSGAKTKLRDVIKYAPTRGIKSLDQSVIDEDDQTDPSNNSNLNNPVQNIENEYKKQFRFSNVYNGEFNWKILKGLKFSSNMNYEFIYNRTEQVWAKGTGMSKENGAQPVAEKYNVDGSSWRISNTLTYDWNLNKQNVFNFLIGQEISQKQLTSTTSLAKFFPIDLTPAQILAQMGQGDPQPITTNIGEALRKISFFGRVNYTLLDKYLFTFTFREDGSNNFSPGNQWGFFPGAAAAWRISDESFMEDQKEWLSNLKLRLSYGQVGNDRVSRSRQDYKSDDLTKTKTYYPNEIIQSTLVPSSRLVNSKLSWETLDAKNIGLDFGIFNQRLSGTVELYWNTTKKLIVDVPLPSQAGYTTQYQNIGQTINKGMEISLNGQIIDKKDFSLSANFNISFNKNEVQKFNGGENNFKEYGSGWNGSAQPTLDYFVKEGDPLGQMYGYVTDGYYSFDDFDQVWDANGNMTWKLKEGIADCSSMTGAGNYFGPGHIKLKKIADDGTNKITENDRKIIGNANPIHVGGFGLNMTYKGFDASVFFNWSYGNDIYNANKLDNTNQLLSRKYQNLSSEMELGKRFTTIDPNTGRNIFHGKYANPELLQELNQNASIWHPLMTQTFLHSWAIEDGSFLRFSNATIGYSIPKKLIKKFSIENLRVYATGYNLYCWTKYTGPDPEVDTRRSTPLTPGVDYSAYPKAISFVGGINVTF